MNRATRLLGVLALLAGAAPLPAGAGEGPAPIRIAWIGPLSGPLAKAGEESLLGARLAAEAGAGKRPAEVVPFDDGEDPKKARALLADAQNGGEKGFAAALAMATGVTVDALEDQARRGRVPVIFVGRPGPRQTVDPTDPALFVGSWPVEQALTLASFLSLHSEKSGLGLYRDCSKPAILAEDSESGREMAEAVRRNIGPRQQFLRTILVKPHAAPAKEELVALRDAHCDRLVLLGEPDLLDRTAEAMRPLGWEVPFFCGDGMLSAAAAAVHDGSWRAANFLVGVPAKAQAKDEPPPEGPPREAPVEDLRKRLGPGAPLYPRTRNGWFAAWMVLRAAAGMKNPDGPGLLPALRGLLYSKEEERERPLLDDTGRTALVQWFLWTMGEKGPEPVRASYLPTRDLGPLMLQKKPGDWDRVEIDKDTRVVWLTFGEKEPAMKSDPPRTIEEDMVALGLSSGGYEGELDPLLRDELQVRTLGKINRLFLKNYDGTSVPGVSFDIHFTFTKPEKVKPSHLWTAIIAGEQKKLDDPGAEAAQPGGMYSGGRVWIFSRWMRKYTAIKDKALRPRLCADDRKFITGMYPWGTSWEENVRSDAIRALVDGYSSFFAMTGAHELGHACGCGHDTESSRSIMNVVEAVGLRDTQACWIPMHLRAVETTLGRWKDGKR